MAAEKDGVIDIVQQAGAIPEYRKMQQYLQSVTKPPSSRVATFDQIGVVGMFNPAENEITYDPKADVGTAIHETAHAVDYHITKQYLRNELSPEAKKVFEQLRFDPYAAEQPYRTDNVMRGMDSPFFKYTKPYRTDPGESVAFAVQRQLAPDSKLNWKAPGHIDATIATEFFILLDKVMKTQTSQPKK